MNISCFRALVGFCTIALSGLNTHLRASLPSNAKVIADAQDVLFDVFEDKNGESVAMTRAKVQVAIPADATTVRFQFRANTQVGGQQPSLGDVAPGKNPVAKGQTADPSCTLELNFSDRTSERLNLLPSGGNLLWDAFLQLPGNFKLYTRPNVSFYKDAQRTQVQGRWESFPAASTHLLAMELRRNGSTLDLWVDGRLLQSWQKSAPLERIGLSVPKGGGIREIDWKSEPASAFRVVPAEALYNVTGAAGSVALTVPAGDGVLEGVPMRVASGGGVLRVAGLGRLSCPSDDLVSFYWKRSAFDGLPESRIISVPLDDYAFAHVLCASDPGSDRVPAFTLRLTRYANGRGGAMADSLVHVPAHGEADARKGESQDCRLVGSVLLGEGKQQRRVPLWLVRVPLKTGLIQDLLREDESKYGFSPAIPAKRYLDLEILDPVKGVEESQSFPPLMKPVGRSYVPTGPQSSVLVCGLTLEVAPAALEVASNRGVSAFYRDESPALIAKVRGAPGPYTLNWEFAGTDGAVLNSGKKELSLVRRDLETVVELPVDRMQTGWYAARIRLFDAAGKELSDNRSSFVLLPPDTRKAGFESPHGAWWFHWAHGGAPDLERVGKMYQRAGLRHANLPPVPESRTRDYNLYEWCIHWKGKLLTTGTTAEKVAAYETYIRETLEQHPSLNTIMIWHESSANGAPVPSELWGEKPVALKESDETDWAARVEILTALLKMIREKFPALKTQWGNSGDGCAMVGELLRRGFPRHYIDTIAVEDLGQTFIPERPLPGAMQSAWLLRQTARVLNAPDAAITACYEWIGRRDNPLGLGGQAAWLVRDALQARAYGFSNVALSTIHDAGKGYFHTIWGSGGLCERYPYMYPKPAYAALATLTSVLDRANFSRVVPTGSLALYAIEFNRPDGPVYALWTPRGKRAVRVLLSADSQTTLTDLYGAEKVLRGNDLSLEVGEEACYLRSSAALEKIIAGSSVFPQEPPPENFQVVEPLVDPLRSELAVVPEPKLERISGWNLPHRTLGQFKLTPVDDPQKGACMELELLAGKPVSWDLMHEYAMVKFKTPVVAGGSHGNVGVWIKGNSGWGDVMWEVANEKGEKWITTGVYWDWPGRLCVNFDGWHFLRLELAEKWRPGLRVTGLIITMPRRALLVTEMAPVPETRVRLKDVTVF
jgi:hypothetical protein